MAGVAAVGIHNDLAAGQAAVPHRPADDKAPRRIDEHLGVPVEEAGGEYGTDDLFEQIGADLFEGRIGIVLGGDKHRIHPHRLTVLVFYRHLGFTVRPQIGKRPLLADLGQLLGQLMRQRDGQGHQLGRFVAGIAEHHALIPAPI